MGWVFGVVGQLLLLRGESATLRLRPADARHACSRFNDNTSQNSATCHLDLFFDKFFLKFCPFCSDSLIPHDSRAIRTARAYLGGTRCEHKCRPGIYASTAWE